MRVRFPLATPSPAARAWLELWGMVFSYTGDAPRSPAGRSGANTKSAPNGALFKLSFFRYIPRHVFHLYHPQRARRPILLRQRFGRSCSSSGTQLWLFRIHQEISSMVSGLVRRVRFEAEGGRIRAVPQVRFRSRIFAKAVVVENQF